MQRPLPRSHVARETGTLAAPRRGIGHLTTQRREFQAQVPDWVPLSKDSVVLASGGVQIALGTSLIVLVRRKALIGRLTALFFTMVFPGNISRFVTETPTLGSTQTANAQYDWFSDPCWWHGPYGPPT